MKRTAGVLASILVLAACTGGGDGGAESTSASASTTAATSVPPTTPPTTGSPPASSGPATTVDSDAQLAAAEQAYLDAFDAYIAAARDPADPDLRAEIERLYTGPNLEFTMNQLDAFVERNWVARPGDEPSRTEILLPPQFLPGRTDLVELVACDIDGEAIFEIGAAPDGSDALVTDEVAVTRGLVRMELRGGQWKARSGENLAELSDPAECIP